MSATTWVNLAPVAAVVAVPLTGWLMSRISRARQGETQAAIHAAVSDAEVHIKDHVDAQFTGLTRRVDELGRSVQAIDSREAQTRAMLAELKGRFDERASMTPPTVIVPPSPGA